jgi:hypothetical protein
MPFRYNENLPWPSAGTEILNDLRVDEDSVPQVPSSATRPTGLLPWESPTYDFEPATNRGPNPLAKAAENSSLCGALLGSDFEELRGEQIETPTKKSATQIVESVVTGLLAKSAFIAETAPARKKFLQKTIDEMKTRLAAKGFKTEWPGWAGLVQSFDEFVVNALLEVEV